MIEIAPSVLAADMLHLEHDVRRIMDAGADMLHVDIMDAHFVPNLSFGPDITAALRRGFPQVHLDVHLMMTHPEDYLDAFAKAGANAITVHEEIGDKVVPALRRIRCMGLMAGISVKPGTPAERLRPLLPLCDLVLIMTVEPGFGGQKMMPEALDKAIALRAAGFEGVISADGGITPDNAAQAVSRGVNRLVMGTAVFRAADPVEAIRRARAASQA